MSLCVTYKLYVKHIYTKSHIHHAVPHVSLMSSIYFSGATQSLNQLPVATCATQLPVATCATELPLATCATQLPKTDDALHNLAITGGDILFMCNPTRPAACLRFIGLISNLHTTKQKYERKKMNYTRRLRTKVCIDTFVVLRFEKLLDPR